MKLAERSYTIIGDCLGFTEGPTVMPDGSIVCVSIDQGRVFRLSADRVSVLALLGGGPNGATVDDIGRLYVAQTGGDWGRAAYPERRDPGVTGGIQTIEPDGTVGWLTRQPVTPNDLCFGPDGMLYVTDPVRRTKDGGSGVIWRCNPRNGHAEILAHVTYFCNGIGFGMDNALYVASSRASQIIRYEISRDKLDVGKVFCSLGGRAPDGFTFDTEGNLIVGALRRGDLAGRVEVYSGNGTLTEVLEDGPNFHPTNIALTSDNQLVVSDSLAGRVINVQDWPTQGLALYPLRSGI